jgi:hypothetical protein
MFVDEPEQNKKRGKRTPHQKEFDNPFGFLLFKTGEQYIIRRHHNQSDGRKPPKQLEDITHFTAPSVQKSVTAMYMKEREKNASVCDNIKTEK